MDDRALHQNVLDELEYDPRFDAAHIGVTVENGIVSLTGHVKNYNQRLDALSAVRRVRGVHAIADRIEVRYDYQPKTADDQIAKRAMDILKWNVTVSQYPIDVLVQSGWITLSGKVKWEFERRAAADCVRKLSGVVGVANKIEIEPRVSDANVKSLIEAALKRHAELESKAIRVSILGPDCVVLEGKVDTLAERQAAENAAWSAAGVRSVEDHITIAK